MMAASLVARLIEAGTPAELVAEVAMELGKAAADRERIEAKRGADRERMKDKRRAMSRDSRDVGDVAEPPKNVPPHPPINTPLKISEPDGSAYAPAAILDPSEEERALFVRGKQVLGANAGGQISRLKAHFGSNVALARSAIETASTKHDPREYVAAILRGRGPPGASRSPYAATGNRFHERQDTAVAALDRRLAEYDDPGGFGESVFGERPALLAAHVRGRG